MDVILTCQGGLYQAVLSHVKARVGVDIGLIGIRSSYGKRGHYYLRPRKYAGDQGRLAKR